MADKNLMGHPTVTMTVDGFEHWGPLVVRPLTMRDNLIAIPSEADKLIPSDNMAPSAAVTNGARALAMLKVVVVHPIDFADRLANSTALADMGFFAAFSRQYEQWMEAQAEEAQAKKSGTAQTETGKESAGTSGNTTDSSLATLTGSTSPKPK